MELCENCKFWVSGDCRKHPPVVMTVETPESKKRTHYQESTHQVTCWPQTKSWQGCGDWEKK